MLEDESKKSNVRDVSCVAILSGRMTGVGGQSIVYVGKKQYLCIVFRKGLKHVSVTFGVRTRCERSRQQQGRKDQTTPLIGKGDLCLRSPQKLKIVWGPQILKPKLLTYESRIDNSYRKFTRCVEEGWLLFPDMQRAADCAKVSSEVDGYTCTKGCTGTLHS